MAKSYADIGLNARLYSQRSLPMARNFGTAIDPLSYDAKVQTTTDRVNASKVNIEEFIKSSDDASALGTFTTSQSFDVTTTLTYAIPQKSYPVFGVPYIAFYEGSGTAAADQIYPGIGNNVTIGRYDVQGAFDLVSWDNIVARWTGAITDTNGTSDQVFNTLVRWSYVDYKTNVAE